MEELQVKRLSIIIPVYNESRTVYKILTKISQVTLINEIEKEIIIINDYSTDDSEKLILEFKEKFPTLDIKYFKHEKNRGKGAALQTGIKRATGECLIVQDADLEYDPNEYNIMLKPVLDGVADVVLGSRFVGGKAHRVLFFGHSLGNKVLTFLSNLFTNLNLTDIETCYKLFKTNIIQPIELKENRFGFEAEVVAKISRIPGVRIYEVGISYYGRTYAEGKKINWKDGLSAIYCIVRYNFLKK
ncbi:MAG: glycosyltransferase family 2 protein [Candidatus Brocadiaceae bacterium]|nr:glycosyltransferase family 2 protein [Candidatus Brocadiaceae bacterium]